jgi:hypothetical protein
MNQIGTVVHYQYGALDAVGAESSHWLAESEQFDVLPPSFTAAKKDGDVGSWEIWIANSAAPEVPDVDLLM